MKMKINYLTLTIAILLCLGCNQMPSSKATIEIKNNTSYNLLNLQILHDKGSYTIERLNPREISNQKVEASTHIHITLFYTPENTMQIKSSILNVYFKPSDSKIVYITIDNQHLVTWTRE